MIPANEAPGSSRETKRQGAIRSGTPLSAALYSFSHLELPDALRVIASMGLDVVDIGVFPDRHHIRTAEVLAGPGSAAQALRMQLEARGLRTGDVFLHPGVVPADLAVNDPDPSRVAEAERRFEATLAFARALGALHLTTLPGVLHRPGNSLPDFDRAGLVLTRWASRCRESGIAFGVEPHVGSLIDSPGKTLDLLGRVPGLGLTLDPSHFACLGFGSGAIEPLIGHANQTHVRPARRGKLQCRLEESAIDLSGFVGKFSGRPGIRHTLEIVAPRDPLCDPVDIAQTVGRLAVQLQSALP